MHSAPLASADSRSAPQQLGQFIPLHYHHLMLADKARTGAFAEAIAKLVLPGSRVLELGGGTGLLSYFAARQGARVTTIELNPELYDFAAQTLRLNGVADSVRLIQADAATYIPPEPVDFVICEMLHSAMLRERQLNVLAEFKKNYILAHGATLPRFIPEVAFLGIQPVEQSFVFNGYRCPLPIFQDPLSLHPDTVELGDAVVYSTIDYAQHVPLRLSWRGTIRITKGGTLTALRFITKNILAVLTDESRAIDWHNAYLLLPLRQVVDVEPGTQFAISFDYAAGAAIDDLAQSVQVDVLPDAPEVTVRTRQGVTTVQ